MIRTLPRLGLGLGWRPELALFIDRRPDLGFVEVIAENLNGGVPIPQPIESLLERGVTIVPHGIELSLGGAEPPDPARIEQLVDRAERLRAPFVTEHIAFVRAGGTEAGHLLPLPRTRESVQVLVENIRLVEAVLPVPLGLENISAFFEWPGNELSEAELLVEVLEQTRCLLLLDVSNLHSSVQNHGLDPEDFLRRVPLRERLAYVHVGGGFERSGVYHDSHAHPVPGNVLELLEEVCSRVDPPGVLLERDDHFPPDRELGAELDAIAATVQHGAQRRKVLHAR